MGMAAGAFILYNLYYFQLEPDYLCRYKESEVTVSCKFEQVCDKVNPPEFYEVDYTSEHSLHNWVEQLSMTCATELEKSFIGSCFFIGAFIGSFILPRGADVVGRKPMFLAGLILYFIVVTALIFNTNIGLAYFLMILGGVSETGRYYVAYVYVVEMMPSKF